MNIEELRTLASEQFGRATLEDVRAWATFAFAAIAAYVGWKRHTRDLKKANKEQQGPWSLRKSRGSHDEEPIFEIRVDEAEQNSFRLHSLRVVAPKGATISEMEWANGGVGENGHYIPSAWVNSIVVNKDMTPDVYYGQNIRTMHYSTYSFMAQFPPQPRWSRQSRTRLVLEVAAEPISSSRSEIRLRVRSHPIEWAAKSAASAT